jgi:ring-1,2-phenylacetyl-CoA epoxidase subunit PaaC
VKGASTPATDQAALHEFLLRTGDNCLIRLSEWCGHSPVLEEDIALANTALDLIGQTQLWLDVGARARRPRRGVRH